MTAKQMPVLERVKAERDAMKAERDAARAELDRKRRESLYTPVRCPAG